jgi:hypothetical protein
MAACPWCQESVCVCETIQQLLLAWTLWQSQPWAVGQAAHMDSGAPHAHMRWAAEEDGSPCSQLNSSILGRLV